MNDSPPPSSSSSLSTLRFSCLQDCQLCLTVTLTRCFEGIWPIKTECWCGCLSGARYRLAYGPADATATHCLLLQENLDWFYLSGTG